MDNLAFPVLVPQSFKGVNLGGMFVPAGPVRSANLQALLATPFQGPMHVHSVPVYYGRPQVTSRPQSPAGFATPGGALIDV
jgi:hypothetical protein